MKVGITGSNGFIGKNFLEYLDRTGNVEVITFTRSDSLSDLRLLVESVDFIFHFAGVNRPTNKKDFYKGNQRLTEKIVDFAMENRNKVPILMCSSIQAEHESDYGKSKLGSELALENYAKKSGSNVYIYRLPNVFGKWSKPNYNTVISTWCYNMSRDLDIKISNENIQLELVYIDDVVECFASHIYDNAGLKISYPVVYPTYQETLGGIHNLLTQFKESRKSLIIPPVGKGFTRALYATYLSFLPVDKFSYELKGHQDQRGAFYEFLKTQDSGQFSISTSAPGVVRGTHYHNTKNEKFLVVKGEASIKLRQIHGDDIVEFTVSDKKLEVVEMIPGYTHDICNTGNDEMILLLWANEIFEIQKPDTYFKEVLNTNA